VAIDALTTVMEGVEIDDGAEEIIAVPGTDVVPQRCIATFTHAKQQVTKCVEHKRSVRTEVDEAGTGLALPQHTAHKGEWLTGWYCQELLP
jgi:hypothetical protein